MNYSGIGHLALVTRDVRATIRFYRDVLGFPLVGTIGGDPAYPYRHYFFQVGSNGTTIAFFEWPEAELPPHKDSGVPASGIQFDHVAIGVESDDDLHEARRRLNAAGYETSDIVDHGICRSLYFDDPNAISLELAVWARDLSVDPFFGDINPVPEALESQRLVGLTDVAIAE